MISAPDPIEILAAPLRGRHLPAETLQGLSAEPCLLVFLRHFG